MPYFFIFASLLLFNCGFDFDRDEKLQITGLSAKPIDGVTMLLSWLAPEHAIAYKVEYKKSDAELDTYHRIKQSSTDQNVSESNDSGRAQISVKDLIPSTKYDFRITALTDKEGYTNSDAYIISKTTSP